MGTKFFWTLIHLPKINFQRNKSCWNFHIGLHKISYRLQFDRYNNVFISRWLNSFKLYVNARDFELTWTTNMKFIESFLFELYDFFFWFIEPDFFKLQFICRFHQGFHNIKKNLSSDSSYNWYNMIMGWERNSASVHWTDIRCVVKFSCGDFYIRFIYAFDGKIFDFQRYIFIFGA